MPANTQYSRPLSSSTITTTTTNKYLDDNEDILSSHPSLTKVYMNKSFALRRQRSNLVPSTSKSVQQQQQQTVSKTLATRQLIKPTTSIPSTSLAANNLSGQTNRAVELRRARAQAKIEELAQRTRQQLQKTEQHNDIMSASWHSNASSTSKKDFSHLRLNPRSINNNNNNNHRLSSQKQDMLKTRTISSSPHHRSSSASPNPLGEPTTKTSKHRKLMTSSVTDESQYQTMNGSTYSEGVNKENFI
jgi:type II secretory pathway pseudopilin PulG